MRCRLGIEVPIMPIRILLKKNIAFTPEDAEILVKTFEDMLNALGLTDREDPATLLVAEKVIEAAKGANEIRSGSARPFSPPSPSEDDE